MSCKPRVRVWHRAPSLPSAWLSANPIVFSFPCLQHPSALQRVSALRRRQGRNAHCACLALCVDGHIHWVRKCKLAGGAPRLRVHLECSWEGGRCSGPACLEGLPTFLASLLLVVLRPSPRSSSVITRFTALGACLGRWRSPSSCLRGAAVDAWLPPLVRGLLGCDSISGVSTRLGQSL